MFCSAGPTPAEMQQVIAGYRGMTVRQNVATLHAPSDTRVLTSTLAACVFYRAGAHARQQAHHAGAADCAQDLSAGIYSSCNNVRNNPISAGMYHRAFIRQGRVVSFMFGDEWMAEHLSLLTIKHALSSDMQADACCFITGPSRNAEAKDSSEVGICAHLFCSCCLPVCM